MEFASVADVRKACRGILTLRKNGKVGVRDESRLKMELIEPLIRGAVFGKSAAVRDACRFIVRMAASDLGIFSASIQELYIARGRGEITDFTIPAVNIRMTTFETARALFRAAKKTKSVFIAEVARSEIGYTHQRPAEYSACVLAAAIREGWRGPVFVQGDHFQANAKAFKKDRKKVVRELKALIKEAVEAGFYNIDIDTSTLVDLEFKTVRRQQKDNYEVGAELTKHVRKCEPKGVTISVGGEIGEVGKKNSTVEEFVEYMDGLIECLDGKTPIEGISKVSIQTGTAHGGMVGKDGKVLDVAIDLGVLDEIGRVAQEKYGIGGTVQHGASTLPDDMFHKFSDVECCEVHLATGFQNSYLDHEVFPAELRERMYEWIRTDLAHEKKDSWTMEQFIYKSRKKTFGPFKAECWNLPLARRKKLMRTLQDKFEFLMVQLKVNGIRKEVEGIIKPVHVPAKMPKGLAKELGA